MTPIDDIRFNVLRNALYHTARRRRLERINRIFNFIIILLGTAVVSQAMAAFEGSDLIVGGLVATIGATQLVFDFGRQARDHQQLQRDYYYLLADIEKAIEPTSEMVSDWKARQIKITADEPPTLRAIDAKAYNDAIDATEFYGEDQRLVIPVFHSIFGNFVPFDGYRYKKICETVT